MRLSNNALRDLNALFEFKSEGGMLQRPCEKLHGHAIYRLTLLGSAAMRLSDNALRDLNAIFEFKSEGGMLQRPSEKLNGHAIKGRSVGVGSLDDFRLS